MNTFLPYPDFVKSAACLDRQRLGKQRVEAYQILRTLLGESDGFKNHPAVKMWRGYEWELAVYGGFTCKEWIERGYQDTVLGKLRDLASRTEPSSRRPPWIGREDFHRSQRANLVRKDAAHYGPIFALDYPDETYNVIGPEPYVWPRNDEIDPRPAISR